MRLVVKSLWLKGPNNAGKGRVEVDGFKSSIDARASTAVAALKADWAFGLWVVWTIAASNLRFAVAVQSCSLPRDLAAATPLDVHNCFCPAA